MTSYVTEANTLSGCYYHIDESVSFRESVTIVNHKLTGARQVVSPNQDARPDSSLSLIIVHGISLPVGYYRGVHIESLFCNSLDCSSHPDFKDLEDLKVSSHLLIRRNSELIQFVPFDRRAWHAGRSHYAGQDACNDFSIGIELEGTDTTAYEPGQYETLAGVCRELVSHYGIDPISIVGHADVSPGRKTDPGEAFQWVSFRQRLRKLLA